MFIQVKIFKDSTCRQPKPVGIIMLISRLVSNAGPALLSMDSCPAQAGPSLMPGTGYITRMRVA